MVNRNDHAWEAVPRLVRVGRATASGRLVCKKEPQNRRRKGWNRAPSGYIGATWNFFCTGDYYCICLSI